jgi:flagellar protein FliS
MNHKVHNAYLEGRILSSDPLTLVCILYDSALENVRAARESLQAGDVRSRSNSISKVSEVLGVLIESLNLDEGKELGGNLLRLYLYMQGRLLEANLRQSDRCLAEVESLLTTLSQSWNQLAKNAAAS